MDTEQKAQGIKSSIVYVKIDETTDIKLRFHTLDVNAGELLVLEVIHPEWVTKFKNKLLNTLGIEKASHETHLQAWLRAMSVENGLALEYPIANVLSDAINNTPGALKFMCILA